LNTSNFAKCHPSEDQINTILQGIANSFRVDHAAPIIHAPEEAGLEYEEVSFSSADGVKLEGWFFPHNDSDKIIIANHPRWFNRAGVNARPPERAILPGNYWEINFIPDYKILHDAGYNILAYDYRNHGESGVTGLFSSGVHESQDVVASIDYIRNRPDTSSMKIGLFSRCNGANSNLHAVRLFPDVFDDIRAIVLVQPITARVIMSRGLEMQGIPLSYLEQLDERVYNTSGFHIDDLTLVPSAGLVRNPTFLYQVHDDFHTRPGDVQSIFDNIPTSEKQLHWIRGTDRRWDGYSWFQEEPELVLEWFARYMG
jgi:pimeloyl-ACP methyl ester carboxylesterase